MEYLSTDYPTLGVELRSSIRVTIELLAAYFIKAWDTLHDFQLLQIIKKQCLH